MSTTKCIWWQMLQIELHDLRFNIYVNTMKIMVSIRKNKCFLFACKISTTKFEEQKKNIREKNTKMFFFLN